MSKNYHIQSVTVARDLYNKLQDFYKTYSFGQWEEYQQASALRFLLELALKQVQTFNIECGDVNRELLQENFNIKIKK